MAKASIRLVVINPQLRFSVGIKQALEQVGGFEVTAFTSAEAAFDYIRKQPQDAALVDLTMPEMPGTDMVLKLRSIQPQIAIIAMPLRPEVLELVHDLDLQGAVDSAVSARELLPVIERAVEHQRDSLPDTAQAPAVAESETLMIENGPPEPPEFSSLDSVLVKMGGLESGGETLGLEDLPAVEDDASHIEQTGRSIEIVVSDAEAEKEQTRQKPGVERAIFEKLASEEPPMPGLEDSGTVGDLMLGVSDSNLGEVLSILRGTKKPAAPPESLPETPRDLKQYVRDLKARAAAVDAEDTERIPAALILESALDETTPLEAFSLDVLMENISRQTPPYERSVRPLPSWYSQQAPGDEEPDFLADLPDDSQPVTETTQPNALNQVEGHPEDLETDRLELTRRSKAIEPPQVAVEPEGQQAPKPESQPETPPDLPEMATPPETEEGREALSLSGAPLAEYSAAQRSDAALSPEARLLPEAEFAEEPAADVSALTAQYDDPYIAQLALHLTQVSLELTAEATLLSREGQVVAYSGALPEEDINDIREIIADDWEARPGEARIRFITLPSSGADYMLYSRRTTGDFSLSMIFAADMPLRMIRRQSDRLAEALNSVPEVREPEAIGEAEEAAPQEEAPAEVAPAGPLTAQTFVWLLSQGQKALTTAIAQAIVAGLNRYLADMGWKIKTFRVHEDYIYLLVDAAAEPAPQDAVRDLMRRSAEIARTQDRAIDTQNLWSDSYLVVIPGRELDIEEIQRFINFARAG